MPSSPSMLVGASSHGSKTPRAARRSNTSGSGRTPHVVGIDHCPAALSRGIAHTKISSLPRRPRPSMGDIRAILHGPHRWSLLLCFLHHAQVQTRDQLVEMLLKRMRHTTTARQRAAQRAARATSRAGRADARGLLGGPRARLTSRKTRTPRWATASATCCTRMGAPKRCGSSTSRCRRTIMITTGPSCGAFIARIARNSSGCPTCSRFAPRPTSTRCSMRFPLFNASNTPVVTMSPQIALDFASVRWQALIRTHRRMETVLKRRPLEVCVFLISTQGCAVAMCMSKAPRPTPITANSCCPGPSVSHAYRPIARRCSSPRPQQDLSPRCASACGRSPSGSMRRTPPTPL